MGHEVKYVPFLKAKQNEIRALAKLKGNVSKVVFPFLDIPRVTNATEVEITQRISSAKRFIEVAYRKNKFPFYLDVFDVPYDIDIEGKHVYDYVLDQFSNFNLVPVVGFDRHPNHLLSVKKHFPEPIYVAVRLVDDDLLSFNLTKKKLKTLFGQFGPDTSFDLILDNRLIYGKDAVDLGKKCSSFINRIDDLNQVNNVIVTSSSIPSLITELVTTQNSAWFSRHEWTLWSNLDYSCAKKVIYGDYTVISPEYSDADIPPELMRSRQTPRIVYTDFEKGFITRGGGLKTHGDHQYYNLANHILKCGIFRPSFSIGDQYIEDVANRRIKKRTRGASITTCGNASKWIETTVICHTSFFATNL